MTGTIPDQTPSADTVAARDAVCSALITGLNANATDGITYTVVGSFTGQSSVYGAEVSGTRVEIPGTRQIAPGAHVLSFTNVDASGATHLSRNGQSPNIFATDAVAHTVTYDNSTYDFNATYNITTTFSYACDVTQHIPATPSTTRLETQGECADRVAHDPDLGPHVNPGQYCLILSNRQMITVPGTPAQDNADPQDSSTGTLDQAGTASGQDTELNGGPYTFQNQSLQVSAVVCNSPGSKGGTWRAQNGYLGLGGACSTATFLSLPPNTGIPSVSLPTS
ncbi:MAG TPA: hypothetical protein VIK68_10170 [Sphingomicrobium sp.]